MTKTLKKIPQISHDFLFQTSYPRHTGISKKNLFECIQHEARTQLNNTQPCTFTEFIQQLFLGPIT